MHIFLSWSGQKSKRLAKVFHSWLPCVIHSAKPFFSELDIEIGESWRKTISDKLELCEIGIFFITSDNIDSPWLIFEAGAMSARKKVCSIFFHHELSSVSGPLEQYQGVNFSEESIHRILTLINDSSGDAKIHDKILLDTFEKWWPELNDKIRYVLDHPEISSERILNKLTWKDIMNAIEELHNYLSETKTSFDYIISFSDGGLIVADLLHVLYRPDAPVISFVIERKEALKHGNSRSLSVIYPIKECSFLKGKKILLLDDVINHGSTLKIVSEHLKNKMKVSAVYTVVLGVAKQSPFKVYHSVFKYDGKCTLPYGVVPRDLPMSQ